MKNRTRKVDVDNDPNINVEELSQNISGKVNKIVDKAIEEANQILGIYGLSAKMQICIEQEKTK